MITAVWFVLLLSLFFTHSDTWDTFGTGRRVLYLGCRAILQSVREPMEPPCWTPPPPLRNAFGVRCFWRKLGVRPVSALMRRQAFWRINKRWKRRRRRSGECVSIKWLKWISDVGFVGRLDLEQSAMLGEPAVGSQGVEYCSVEEMEAAFLSPLELRKT